MTNDFSVDTMVQAIRQAAAEPDPEVSVRDVLQETIMNPEQIFVATSDEVGDEVLYFEDDTVSIWRCVFQPNILMPPHEHCLEVLIGAYSGGEKSILYERTADGLKEIDTVIAYAGEVIALDKDAIHAVTTQDDQPSHAIHVYFGPLMKLERDLFDWDSGHAVNFTLENFDAMKRSL